MCGIVGCTASVNVAATLMEGLKRLEYRGYDSAGVSIANGHGLHTVRRVGKLRHLEDALRDSPPTGTRGIGHTRWATHGKPSEENAHPHADCRGRVMVAHNGIIENHAHLRAELQQRGHQFRSETDSEVLAHLIEEQQGPSLLESVRRALKRVEGSYAVVVLSADHPDILVGARRESPLLVGIGQDANYLASDVPAILSHTRRVVDLQDGDVAEIGPRRVVITDLDGAPVERAPRDINWDPVAVQKGGYKHFMLKEIEDQPSVLAATIGDRIAGDDSHAILPELDLSVADAKALNRVVIIACGTSLHAGLVGKFYLERMAGLSTEVDFASEFRYRDPILKPNDLVIAISQSGETADTLGAARLAKTRGARLAAICNVQGSSLCRESSHVMLTAAGPEIGVASTKAFTTQLAVLYLAAVHLGRLRGTLGSDQIKERLGSLRRLRHQCEITLGQRDVIERVARELAERRDFLYLGRGINYPIALEGALKLKEISYIHAEGYPAGEMKHGPIALIDKNLPVVVIAPKVSSYEKIVSNVEEVRAREGLVLAVGTRGDEELKRKANYWFELPPVPEEMSPIVSILPLQLLAYHVASWRGCDVDQPRNLAKSVTVE
ncbi:MAG: glutamine--fructose-6-phosphate transaminase (isomerizing) [Planctomycetota bacterium]